MRDLFRAEWIKVAGNRWVAIGLIWIFPITTAAFIALAALILALSSQARADFAVDEEFLWTNMALAAWNFPNHPFLRIILLGFAAVVFAGEYQWSTWKNTVPRNQRVALIVIKFFTLGVFVVFAFVLMSIILAVGWGLLAQMAGAPYGPKLTGDVFTTFVGDYTVQASTAFTTTIIAAGYAALAGMITRSILGGVLVSFVITLGEAGSIIGLIIVGNLLDIRDIVHAYRFTPTYNVVNVLTWINDKHAANMDVFEDGAIVFTDSLAFSLVVLAAWVIGLIALVAWLFRRQDITS